jgi:tRNA (mo5U34)-methyltransferase
VTALDVANPGDLDLPWEARQRDAKVPPLREGTNAARRFELARQLLGSRVERLSCTVYDLDPAVHGRFDVVLCGTLLVHLRDPIRALERIRDVCTGELVLVECVDAILDLSAFRHPAARFAPSQAQWWRANTAGLHSALRVAGFEVLSTSRRFVTPFGAGITAGRTGLRRLLAGARSTLVRWPMLTRMPGLVEALGLWRGSFDIVIRARPRSIA